MYTAFMTAALTGILLLPASICFPKAAPVIRMVETSIGLRLLDGNGLPLNLTNGLRLEMFRFGQTPWERNHWAIIVGRPDSDGNMLGLTKFPVDSIFLMNLVHQAGGREHVDLGIGLRILDGSGRTTIRPSAGVRLELYRFGKYAWPSGRVAVVRGNPDGDGYLRTTIRLPIDANTLRNFTLLANGQGQ